MSCFVWNLPHWDSNLAYVLPLLYCTPICQMRSAPTQKMSVSQFNGALAREMGLVATLVTKLNKQNAPYQRKWTAPNTYCLLFRQSADLVANKTRKLNNSRVQIEHFKWLQRSYCDSLRYSLNFSISGGDGNDLWPFKLLAPHRKRRSIRGCL